MHTHTHTIHLSNDPPRLLLFHKGHPSLDFALIVPGTCASSLFLRVRVRLVQLAVEMCMCLCVCVCLLLLVVLLP
jgi:hypothetical protein